MLRYGVLRPARTFVTSRVHDLTTFAATASDTIASRLHGTEICFLLLSLDLSRLQIFNSSRGRVPSLESRPKHREQWFIVEMILIDPDDSRWGILRPYHGLDSGHSGQLCWSQTLGHAVYIARVARRCLTNIEDRDGQL